MALNEQLAAMALRCCLFHETSRFLFHFTWPLFRFELALQQNDTLDVFVNDYLHLGEADSTFGSHADNHLKV